MARKILLADDSVTAQSMGRRILSEAGYEVTTVNNGSAALKKIAENQPDLIVLDVYMPGYGGLEVCQRLKDAPETARIPVLLTVGKLEPFKADEARRVHADAYLVKPFEATELLAVLTKLEDKIIPPAEPAEPENFAKALAAVEQSNTGKETKLAAGKGRLRGVRATHSEEVESAAAQTRTGFRNIPHREAQPAAVQSAAQPSAGVESIGRALPNDITLEELTAITAAAAALREDSGETGIADTEPSEAATYSPGMEAPAAAQWNEMPAVEAAPAEISYEATGPVESSAAQEVSDETAEYPAAAPAAEIAEPRYSAPVYESAAAYEPPAVYEEARGDAPVAEQPYAERPREDTWRTLRPSQPEAAPVVEFQPEYETATAETQAEPAPYEAASQVAPATEDAYIAEPPMQAAEPTASYYEAPPVAASEPAADASWSEPPVTTPEEAASPGAAGIPAPRPSANWRNVMRMPEVPAAGTHDAELAAALDFLSPIAERLPQYAGSGSRWIAEEVALSQQETSLILEQEMAKAYAAMAEAGLTAAEPPAASAPEYAAEYAPEPSPGYAEASQTEMTAAQEIAQEEYPPAGAESPEPAMTEPAMTEPAMTEPEFSQFSQEVAYEVPASTQYLESSAYEPAAEVSDTMAPPPAEYATEAESQAVYSSADAAASDLEPAYGEAMPAAGTEAQSYAEPQYTEAASTSIMPASEVNEPAAPTAAAEPEPKKEAAFAAAAAAQYIASEMSVFAMIGDVIGPAGGGAEATAGTSQPDYSADASAGSIGEPVAQPAAESPGSDREAELAAAWAHWRQIRDSAVGPAFDSHAPEVAATEFREIHHDAPAEAEAATPVAAAPAAGDPNAIASIVDSVLAELRPKLVQEIAKKLSEKK